MSSNIKIAGVTFNDVPAVEFTTDTDEVVKFVPEGENGDYIEVLQWIETDSDSEDGYTISKYTPEEIRNFDTETIPKLRFFGSRFKTIDRTDPAICLVYVEDVGIENDTNIYCEHVTYYIYSDKSVGCDYNEETKSILDTSDATATSDDILETMTAYVKGEKITGELTDHRQHYLYTNFDKITWGKISRYEDGAIVESYATEKGVIDNNLVVTYVDKSNFGNALTDDVAQGKTFTSENGLKLVGTKVLPTVQEVKNITANGEFYPDSGYDAISKLIVNVPGGVSGGTKTLIKIGMPSELDCTYASKPIFTQEEVERENITDLSKVVCGGVELTPGSVNTSNVISFIQSGKNDLRSLRTSYTTKYGSTWLRRNTSGSGGQAVVGSNNYIENNTKQTYPHIYYENGAFWFWNGSSYKATYNYVFYVVQTE